MHVYCTGQIKKTAYATMAVGILTLAVPRAASAASCTPYGGINTDWESLGGPSSFEGNCVGNEEDNDTTGFYGASGRYEQFQGGWINWDGTSAVAYAVGTKIANAWFSRYGGPTWGQPAMNDTTDGGDQAVVTFTRLLTTESYPTYDTYYLVVNNDQAGGCTVNSDHICQIYGSIATIWNQWTNYFYYDIGLPQDEEHFANGSTTERVQHFSVLDMAYTPISSNPIGIVCGYEKNGTPVYTNGTFSSCPAAP